MLNSQTLTSRQNQPFRRVVGAALMPTLVRLAECADTEISDTARAVVMALYGARGSFVTRAGLANLTTEELETALDVLGNRGLAAGEVIDYLRRYCGQPTQATQAAATTRRVLQLVQAEPPSVGFDCLAQVRDMEMHSPRGLMAARILKLDFLGRITPAARAHLAMLPRDAIRGLLAEFVEYDLDENTLLRMVESVCS
jgi:hypothetical protein